MENKYKEKYSEDVRLGADLEIDNIINKISVVRKRTTENIELLKHFLGCWSRSNFNPKAAYYILQLIQYDIDRLAPGIKNQAYQKKYAVSDRSGSNII